MNLQHERIDAHCHSLKLEGLMNRYVSLAGDASTKSRHEVLGWIGDEIHTRDHQARRL